MSDDNLNDLKRARLRVATAVAQAIGPQPTYLDAAALVELGIGTLLGMGFDRHALAEWITGMVHGDITKTHVVPAPPRGN